jgi:hypothetical protein
MTTGYKRKADDARIVALNSVGLSLTTIAQTLGVHHTTITYRLRSLGVQPADTRRAFMEDIFNGLTQDQQEWLLSQLHPGHSVKDYVRSLILKAYMERNTPTKQP